MPVLFHISNIFGHEVASCRKGFIMGLFSRKAPDMTEVLAKRIKDEPPKADEPREYVRIMPTVTKPVTPTKQSRN